MTTIQPGEFWIAEISFTSGISAKKRPVLILWIDGQDAMAAVVTSAPPRTPTDIFLDDWSFGGLRVASTVRLSRLDCLEKSLFLAKIGQISDSDAVKVKEAWQNILSHSFNQSFLKRSPTQTTRQKMRSPLSTPPQTYQSLGLCCRNTN